MFAGMASIRLDRCRGNIQNEMQRKNVKNGIY